MKTNETETEPELASQETAAEEAIPEPPPRVPLPHERFAFSIHSADDASQAPRVPGEVVVAVHSRQGTIGKLYGASDLDDDEREKVAAVLAIFARKIERGKDDQR